MPTINERLRTLRKALKLSAAELGRNIGFSQSTVSLVELGRPPYDNPEKISDSYIKTVCLVYNVNESWLHSGEGEMFMTTPPGAPRETLAAQVLELVEKVPTDELRRIVKDFIGALVESSLLTQEDIERILDQHRK